jgi:hypothetical protein
MAATKHTVAVDHPTVVPTNFESESESDRCPDCEMDPCEC